MTQRSASRMALLCMLLALAAAASAGGCDPDDPCSCFASCGECVADSRCGWCDANAVCMAGGPAGPKARRPAAVEGGDEADGDAAGDGDDAPPTCSAWSFAVCPGGSCGDYGNCRACLSDAYCGWCAAEDGGQPWCAQGDSHGPLESSLPACDGAWVSSPLLPGTASLDAGVLVSKHRAWLDETCGRGELTLAPAPPPPPPPQPDDPAIESVTPEAGPQWGHTVLTITGAYFGDKEDGAVASVGGQPCLTTTWESASVLRCVVPPGPPGVAAIEVSVLGRTSNISVAAADNVTALTQFTYEPLLLHSMSPANGTTAGGDVLAIAGAGFGQRDFQPTVTIGKRPCLAVVWRSDKLLHCISPPGWGVRHTVTLAIKDASVSVDGAGLPVAFSYNAPELHSITPTHGPSAGGYRLHAHGANFGSKDAPRKLQLGDVDCPDLQWHGHTHVSCLVPSGLEPALNVTITVGSRTTAAGEHVFSFDAPTVTSVDPPRGPTAGGYFIFIHGTNFGAAHQLKPFARERIPNAAFEPPPKPPADPRPEPSMKPEPTAEQAAAVVAERERKAAAAAAARLAAEADAREAAVGGGNVGDATGGGSVDVTEPPPKVTTPTLAPSSEDDDPIGAAVNGGGAAASESTTASVDEDELEEEEEEEEKEEEEAFGGSSRRERRQQRRQQRQQQRQQRRQQQQQRNQAGRRRLLGLPAELPAELQAVRQVEEEALLELWGVDSDLHTATGPNAFGELDDVTIDPEAEFLPAETGGTSASGTEGMSATAAAEMMEAEADAAMAAAEEEAPLTAEEEAAAEQDADLAPAAQSTPAALEAADLEHPKLVMPAPPADCPAHMAEARTPWGVRCLEVKIGERPCTRLVAYSDDLLGCKVPPNVGRGFTVQLFVAGRETAGSNATIFDYDGPAVHSVQPPHFPPHGGVQLVITGRNFGVTDRNAAALVGNIPCLQTTWLSDTQLKCKLPAGLGIEHSVDVIVAGQRSRPNKLFRYDAPIVHRIEPDHGPTGGGTLVTVHGANFGVRAHRPAVQIGGRHCTAVQYVSDSELRCLSPPGHGQLKRVDVVSGGQATPQPPRLWSYDAPVVMSVQPNHCSVVGGCVVTLRGDNFGHHQGDHLEVRFDGKLSPEPRWLGHGAIRAVVPPGTGKERDIQVTVSGQTSNLNGLWHWNPPAVHSVRPTHAPPSGNIWLNITGADFGHTDLAPMVTVGGARCVESVWRSNSEIGCLLREGFGYNLTVAVALEGQASFRNESALFSFDSPIISSISPRNGRVVGGTLVTVRGRNFAPGLAMAIEKVGGAGFYNVPLTRQSYTKATYRSPPGVGRHLALQLFMFDYRIETTVRWFSHGVKPNGTDDGGAAAAGSRPLVSESGGESGGESEDSDSDTDGVGITGSMDTPGWDGEPWTECSKPCGGGTRTRKLRCLKEGVPVAEDACPQPKPAIEETCNKHRCGGRHLLWAVDAQREEDVSSALQPPPPADAPQDEAAADEQLAALLQVDSDVTAVAMTADERAEADAADAAFLQELAASGAEARGVGYSVEQHGGSFRAQPDWAASKWGGAVFASGYLHWHYWYHMPIGLIDSEYGNHRSWIPGGRRVGGKIQFVVRFAQRIRLERVAWGRDNTNRYGDRTHGAYRLQYTTAERPNLETADSAWKELFTVHNTNRRRTLFKLSTPVADVTGVRMILSNGGVCIDEFEAYGAATGKAAPQAKLVTVGGSFLPGVTDWALRSAGTHVWASGQYPHPYHYLRGLTDGVYGNHRSWIPGPHMRHGRHYAVLRFPKPITIAKLAWGRNNMRGADWRERGTYQFEVTTTPAPQLDTPDREWRELFVISYNTTWNVFSPRHLYQLTQVAKGVTGLRLRLDNPHVCIDELEVYDTSEPSVTLETVGGGPLADASNWAAASNGATAVASSHWHVFSPATTIDGVVGGRSYGWIAGWHHVRGKRFLIVRFEQPVKLERLAWSRDSLGRARDRVRGLWVVQTTMADEPGVHTPDGEWKELFRLNRVDSHEEVKRHLWKLTKPVEATAVRFLVPEQHSMIQEVEAYGQPAAPEDDNAELVRRGGSFLKGTNFAAAKGAALFVSGSPRGSPANGKAALTDGKYGASPCWRPGSAQYRGLRFVTLALPSRVRVTTIAWGRDNTGKAFDSARGQVSVQYTTAEEVTKETAELDWAPLFNARQFSGKKYALRQEYKLKTPTDATGIRLVLSDANMCFDELEVYGEPVSLEDEFDAAALKPPDSLHDWKLARVTVVYNASSGAELALSAAAADAMVKPLWRYNPPEVVLAHPAVINGGGGQKLLIVGRNLGYGPASKPAVWLRDTGDGVTTACASTAWLAPRLLQCMTPPVFGPALEVIVGVGGQNGSRAGLLSVEPPRVTHVSPRRISFLGGRITIGGAGFGQRSHKVAVDVGGKPCRAPRWLSDSQLTCTAPAGSGSAVVVNVTVGGRASNRVRALAYTPPSLNVVSPRYARPGAWVRAQGVGFGASPRQPGVTILLNGRETTTQWLRSGELRFRMPPAGSGQLRVQLRVGKTMSPRTLAVGFTQDCKLGPWGGWGRCNRDCEGGLQWRWRRVLQRATPGGRACGQTSESRACNTHKCWELVARISPTQPFVAGMSGAYGKLDGPRQSTSAKLSDAEINRLRGIWGRSVLRWQADDGRVVYFQEGRAFSSNRGGHSAITRCGRTERGPFYSPYGHWWHRRRQYNYNWRGLQTHHGANWWRCRYWVVWSLAHGNRPYGFTAGSSLWVKRGV